MMDVGKLLAHKPALQQCFHARQRACPSVLAPSISFDLTQAATSVQSSYVGARFHNVLVAGSLFFLFAGYYFWVRIWNAHIYNEWRGKFHFWNSLILVNGTFFPMHFLGLGDLPPRYADYASQFTDFHALTSMGALLVGLIQVYFLFTVVLPTIKGGETAAAKPRAGADGPESTVPSPAPFHTFEVPPVMK